MLNGIASYDQDQSGQSITRYDWDINGDGTFDYSGQTLALSWIDIVNHGGTAEDGLPVTLRVNDNEGATGTTSAQVSISTAPPVSRPTGRNSIIPYGADLELDGTQSYDPDDFYGGSNINGVGITRYEWDINGDGVAEKTGATTSYTWDELIAIYGKGAPGNTMMVWLIVTDNEGQTDKNSISFTLGNPQLPVAVITPAGAATSLPTIIALDGGLELSGLTSYDADEDGDSIVSYRWDLGSDNIFEITGPELNVAWDDIITSGMKYSSDLRVTLEVTDNEGQIGRSEFVAAVELPTVTIEATDRLAGKAGPDTGTFTITRSNTRGSLVVKYSMSGSAFENRDYIDLNGFVTIASGKSSAIVTITPVNNNQMDTESETATATISPASKKYKVGTPSSDTVVIRQINGSFPSEFLSKDDADARIGNHDRFDFYMSADELSGHSFQRTLTAGDPNGDAIEWSITDPSEKFEINAATGQLKLKSNATVSTGTTVTLQATATSIDGTDKADVTINVATAISLKSVDFTSDHEKLRKELDPTPTFASNGDGRFHAIEWLAGQHADPLTHTMGERVVMKVTLEGVPSGLTYDLVGDSPELTKSLDFRASGLTQSTATLTGEQPLRPVIGKLDAPIAWSVVLDGQTVPIGTSQNKIYVTYGTPAPVGDEVTVKRIDWLTTTTAGLGIGDEQEIVAAIHSASAKLANFHLLMDESEVTWALLDGLPVVGECINHVRLLHAAVNMLGASSGEVGYVFPRTDADVRGEYFTDGGEAHSQKSPGDVRIVLQYLDGKGRRNRYEAVYKMTAGGATKYYGGFSGVFDSVEDVMSVALSLVWFNFRTGEVSQPFPFQ